MNSCKIILTTTLICLVSLVQGQEKPLPLPKCKNGFIVIAHRGSHLVKPENTLAAIEEAIQLGADYVEIDLRTTKDGALVLSHNETVDQQTNGIGRVRDLKLEEIKNLLVKSRDGDVYRIPSFTEVLKICKNRINIYLDFKDADAELSYREIKAAAMENQILVYLNKADQYVDWKRTAPEMPLMSSLSKAIKTKEELEASLAQHALQAVDNITDPVILAALREKGISVFLDVQSTDENPAKWKAAMRKGVQGVQTDHPGDLISYLKKYKLRDGDPEVKIK
ncbi:glycerophosphoryl diester phosphodiesterase [Pedobacter cryoconitis]|uniref:Glycerophosphoryl diester phosphodiesterase n=1 Tax=Pedobacter cryoconitis TaxID=188932 RepID=A0A7W9DXJ0_9SPHI|nr:glycerophosphodiester phosphodiesterase family protein [Pedobacter cryoconitis]MBB5635182.1 glycerophosphoryl diester phosphodiesterase [Pedobacter cryoconitis]